MSEPLGECDLDPLHVAIDGPAGSGKSTVAAALAERLGLLHVETGAMYRALTLLALRESISPDDGEALSRRLESVRLRMLGPRLHVGDEDVSEAIRSPEVTARVSAISAHAPVRRAMVRRQRELSWDATEGAVMEGRDIGTVVLPLARCKIYLDASSSVRARRRALQAGLGTDPAVLGEVQRDIETRDALDSTRAESPLRVAPDAHVLDTSHLSFDEVVDACARLAEAARWREPDADHLAKYLYHHRRYRVARTFLDRLLRRGFGLRVFGRSHQGIASSVIFASNHISWFDPPINGAGVEREMYILAKRELFVGPFGRLIAAFNAVPIARGRFDAQAFARAQEVLEQKGSLLIYPEGTRRKPGHPGPIKKGLGLLTVTTGKPYVPLYIRGSNALPKALFRLEPLELWIGAPVLLHALGHLRQTLDDRQIQERVGDLFLQQIQALAHRSQWRQASRGRTA